MSRAIAIYARVSSEKQAEAGTIESQVAALKEHVKSHGFTIDNDLIFVDNGVSGATLERPGLDALRDRSSLGQIEKVFIHNPDRLARKHAHQLILIEEFKRLGVEICFANRSISETPEDQLLLQIQGVISEFEREKIIERHRRGKLHKARQGKINVLVCAPYGYVYVRKSESADARFEIHPIEAEVVRRVFRMYTKDMMSIRAIGRELTNEKIPTRNQIGRWEPSVVWAMLRNPAYYGCAGFRKTMVVKRTRPTKLARDRGGYPKHGISSNRERPKEEWITIPVPAIIDQETFEKAKERLEENKRLSPRNNKKNQYLLSGLMHCKECGYSLYGVPSNSRYRRCYYRCMGQDGYRWAKGRCCSSHPVRVEALDDVAWEATRRLIEQPKVVFEEYVQRLNARKRNKGSLESLVNKKRLEIKHLEQEKERLLDLYQTGAVSKKEIESRLERIRAKMKRLDDEQKLFLREMERDQEQLRLIEHFDSFKSKIAGRLQNLTFEEKKAIVRLLVTEVVVDTKNDEIAIRHIIPSDESSSLCSGRKYRAFGYKSFKNYRLRLLNA